MGRPLTDILEMQFSLGYSGVLSKSEFEETDLKEIEWTFGRLVKLKQDERENAKKAQLGKSYTEQMNG